ncbi:PREDICTED: RNA-directed DNA methylation 4-like isoform X1 [Camelina sativa]|uniref:RNA-directed DNA methylation 4-like isoform X1 n=1 Tax=Camelina sativa TaxID=90675 RepID=A0ABM0Y0M1_CAMSA|nr:PREDICTED: RNA-directed DNA methylation 4-like isoform X1 [Camelina sativa]XP_010493681.1 PREDICTED: RNA-directed DNA methylation 4-like isoform X1 [Camelina sativa]
MDAVGEGSSTQKNEVGEKPVIVRVKRKVGQSLLDAFWLEINERPLKRQTLALSQLSISNSGERGSSVSEDVKPKKVLVRHLETVTDYDTTADIIHSFFESDLNDKSGSKVKFDERKISFKKDNRKDQRLTKAVQLQQIAAENARFEQIWRSRKGNKEGIHDRCHFYDILRVDAEERRDTAQEVTSLEDQKMLASFLPLLRECIPTAAEEIEADIHSSRTEEYVYDYYAVNDEMDVSEDSCKSQFPLVIVEDEDDFCDGPDESDYDSDDSNAEEHPKNDYPDEISEDEEEEKKEDDDDDDDETDEEKSEASDESEDEETAERHVRRVLGDDEFDDYEDYGEDADGYGDSDDEFESSKWSYR